MALTLLASIVSLIDGEYPIALLFLCGTVMFAIESVTWRLKRAAIIVRGAQEVLGPAGEPPTDEPGRGPQSEGEAPTVTTGVKPGPR